MGSGWDPTWVSVFTDAEQYYVDVNKAMEKVDNGGTVLQSTELQDGPSTLYAGAYKDLHDAMLKGLGSTTDEIYKRMVDLQPNGDPDKLIPWLVFWLTVYYGYQHPYGQNPVFLTRIDPVAAPSSSLRAASDSLDGLEPLLNLVITMDVAVCLDLNWGISVGGSGASASRVPSYFTFIYSATTFDLDILEEVIWGNFVKGYKTNRLLMEPVQTRADIKREYPWTRQSFDHSAHKKKKPVKPVQPIHTPTASDSSSSGGMWILLLLLLVAGMYLYSK